MHQCTLAVECMSVVLSCMGVLSGGWFLHRIGISIIHATLCFVGGNTNHHTNKKHEIHRRLTGKLVIKMSEQSM